VKPSIVLGRSIWAD